LDVRVGWLGGFVVDDVFVGVVDVLLGDVVGEVLADVVGLVAAEEVVVVGAVVVAEVADVGHQVDVGVVRAGGVEGHRGGLVVDDVGALGGVTGGAAGEGRCERGGQQCGAGDRACGVLGGHGRLLVGMAVRGGTVSLARG
jgi:hypothetical protein